jgi:hypothetical protein
VPGESCPRCRTARVGALRFCRTCAFDFDSVRPSASAADHAPSVAAIPQEQIPAIAASRSRDSSRLWLIPAAVGAAVLVLVVVAGAIFVSGIGKHDIKGSYLLVASDPSVGGIETTDTGCHLSGRAERFVLSVADGSGHTMSSTTLAEGSPKANACEWRFTLTGVSETSAYVFNLDGRAIGTTTLDHLRATNWATVVTEDAAPPPADLNF